jgi:hypothetical protein
MCQAVDTGSVNCICARANFNGGRLLAAICIVRAVEPF